MGGKTISLEAHEGTFSAAGTQILPAGARRHAVKDLPIRRNPLNGPAGEARWGSPQAH
jgi:hypothetical protein